MTSTISGAKLTMFGVISDDLPSTLAFYRLLGLDIPASADDAPHVDFQLPGGLRLSWDIVDTIRSFDPDWQPPTGGSHRFAIAFELESAEAVNNAYQQIVDAGFTGHLKPWDAVWGQRYAIVKDPDGNAVDLFANLPR